MPAQLYEAIVGGKSEVSTKNQRRKKLTIFFSDITNFTATTDILEPEAMSELLNDYLNHMANIAVKHGGTVDKFVGDAVMVFFGDPESLGEVDVKGIHHPIPIYRVVLPGDSRDWDEAAEFGADTIAIRAMRLARSMPPSERLAAAGLLRRILETVQGWA